MTPLRLAAVIGAFLSTAVSQSDSDKSASGPKVWAAVAFVSTGDSTPVLGGLQSILTPEGAQQMLRQGAAFRNRYLTGSGSQQNGSSKAPIEGISQDVFDTDQIGALSTSDFPTTSGATAFFQGLYPANSKAFNEHAGGSSLANDLATSSNVSYPLDGYQYTNVLTTSLNDGDWASLDGTDGCIEWQKQVNSDMDNDQQLIDNVRNAGDFYQRLFSTFPMEGTLPVEQAIYDNAYELYQFVNYQYKHNETVLKGLGKEANATIETMASHALDIERARIGSAAGNSQDSGAVTHSIAGRTLARKVIDELSGFVNKTSGNNKLSLLFGAQQSLSSFFSVGDLLTNENLMNTPFGNLTQPGSALVFELIGNNKDDPNGMPGSGGLSVRFSYRAGADGDDFKVYSLFGSGSDGNSIPYESFLTEMMRRGRTSNQWCQTCQPGSLVTFCYGGSSSNDNTPVPKNPMSPALGGVIGGIIMLAAFGLIGLILFFFGFRMRKVEGTGFRREKPPRNRDRDIRVLNDGQRQARMGSWEMRDQHRASTALGGDEPAIQPVESGRQTDDESVRGATAVNPRESV